MQRRRTDFGFDKAWPTPFSGPDGNGRLPRFSQDAHGGVSAASPRRILNAYVEQIDFEILRHLRMPSFLLPALLFPALFYGMFLTAYGAPKDPENAAYWLANYASFAAIVPGLFLFCISAATDGASAYTLLQRVLPAPAGAPLIGKLALAVLMAACSAFSLVIITWAMGGALPPAGSAVELVATASACTLPFCGLGMLIGSIASGKNAIMVVNLVLLPLVFLSGLLVPQQLLPNALQALSIYSPGHDVLMLALSAVRPDLPAPPWHAVYLALFALVLGGLAEWRTRQPL